MDAELFTMLTAQLFTISFISIGLTPPPASTAADGGRTQKVLLRGAWAMGLTWTLVFSIQALVGLGVVGATGRFGGIDPIYGFMVPFAFAQGPGQAVTFAEQYVTERSRWTGSWGIRTRSILKRFESEDGVKMVQIDVKFEGRPPLHLLIPPLMELSGVDKVSMREDRVHSVDEDGDTV